jgi:hypothetical protein
VSSWIIDIFRLSANLKRIEASRLSQSYSSAAIKLS